MNKCIVYFIALTLFVNCGQSQELKQTSLQPPVFEQKMNQLNNETLVDVRTGEEFAGGHLPNALNIDWKSADFEQKITELDKSKPVFVYCQSGKRSAAAAEKMRTMGFVEVYELQGGILKWRENGLKEVTE